MTLKQGAALLSASMMLGACSDAGGTGSFENAALETDDQKASYGIGMNVGNQIVDTRDRLDRLAFMRGIEDAMQSNDPAVDPQELQTVLQAFAQEIQAAAAEAAAAAGVENAAAGEAYLAENGAREGVITTASGLQYEVLTEGAGDSPTPTSQVRVHYRGTLIDGTEFDSSLGGEPATFSAGGLITGFTEALLMMSPGSKFRIVIPADIAYGPGGSGLIGPNSTLIFELELIEVIG